MIIMQHVIPPPRNSTDPIIVAFCGGKFHGKDTAAKVLIDRYGFRKVSFADGLKKCVATALRVPVSVFEDPKLKETIHEPSGKTYRYWLQIAGTEWFRSMWDGIWISWWKNELAEKNYERVVVTDLRFPNEMIAVREMANNFVFRIHNPYVPPSGDTHASESHYENFVVDHIILNEDGIPELQTKVLDQIHKRYPSELYFSI